MSSKALAAAMVFGTACNDALFKFNIDVVDHEPKAKSLFDSDRGDIKLVTTENTIEKERAKPKAKMSAIGNIKDKKSAIGKTEKVVKETVEDNIGTWDTMKAEAVNMVKETVEDKIGTWDTMKAGAVNKVKETVEDNIGTWDKMKAGAVNIFKEHVQPLVDKDEDIKGLVNAAKEHDIDGFGSIIKKVASELNQKYHVMDTINQQARALDYQYHLRDNAAESAFQYLDNQRMAPQARRDAKKTVYHMLFDEDLMDDAPVLDYGRY